MKSDITLFRDCGREDLTRLGSNKIKRENILGDCYQVALFKATGHKRDFLCILASLLSLPGTLELRVKIPKDFEKTSKAL